MASDAAPSATGCVQLAKTTNPNNIVIRLIWLAAHRQREAAHDKLAGNDPFMVRASIGTASLALLVKRRQRIVAIGTPSAGPSSRSGQQPRLLFACRA